MSFGARALIRLGALKHNLRVIRDAAPEARVMAVIKANAYGHGMLTAAQHLSDADSFAVARLPEALALRIEPMMPPCADCRRTYSHTARQRGPAARPLCLSLHATMTTAQNPLPPLQPARGHDTVTAHLS